MKQPARKARPGSFGRRVRSHREKLGITMNQLARQVEMDQGLLSKIERGLRPPPEIIPHVQRIAEAFGFERGSAEYEELTTAAFQERFPMRAAPVIVTLMPLGEPARSRGGLSGLPADLAAPGSPASQYYASLRAKAFETTQPAAAPAYSPRRDKEQPPKPPALAGIAFGLRQAIDLFVSMGINVMRFEQGEEGFECVFKVPDGTEYEMRIRPKNPSIPGTDSKEGERQ